MDHFILKKHADIECRNDSFSRHESILEMPSLETLVASDIPQPLFNHMFVELITSYDPSLFDIESG
jgi:hypothetical protein